MARETRFARRILSKCLLNFLELNKQGKDRAWQVCSPDGTPYVFLGYFEEKCPRDHAKNELSLRCLVTRKQNPDQHVVVGIAMGQPALELGTPLDVCYRDIPSWTPEQDSYVESMQKALGYFANPQQTTVHEDEYPDVG